MLQFYQLLAGFMRSILDLFKVEIVSFSIYSVTLYHILLAFLVLSIVITVFWRGGRG